jgi:cobalt/nickel transport system permease protein
MTDAMVIPLPLWQFAAMLLIPLTGWFGAVSALRWLVRRRRVANEDPDWSIPPLSDLPGKTLFHRWDVRPKLVSLLVYCFLVASLQQLAPALAAIGISTAALLLARSDILRALMRFLAVTGFLGLLLLIMPLTAPVHPADTVVVVTGWEWLSFNLRGLTLAAVIAAKGVAIALLMEPLFATAPLPVTLHGLSKLGFPDMVGQMVLLSHRYVHVFRHEAQRMSSGMQVRGFRKRTDLSTLRAVANFLGMLLVRSFERTERVFDAMRARGYQGKFPEPVTLRLRKGDLVLAAGWLALGVTLILYDRLH